MIILTIRTDKPEAEIGLFDDQKQIKYIKWPAHRQLAENIHTKILDLLKMQDKQWSDIQAVVCYEGPGSFTGLRIGVAVANSLAYSLGIPIVANSSDNWILTGIERLLAGETDKIAIPEYGAPAATTKQRK